jgi:hypothetical protein
MQSERIFARKLATRMLSSEEIDIVAGGSGYPPGYVPGYPSEDTACWQEGAGYYILDDCPVDWDGTW